MAEKCYYAINYLGMESQTLIPDYNSSPDKANFQRSGSLEQFMKVTACTWDDDTPKALKEIKDKKIAEILFYNGSSSQKALAAECRIDIAPDQKNIRLNYDRLSEHRLSCDTVQKYYYLNFKNKRDKYKGREDIYLVITDDLKVYLDIKWGSFDSPNKQKDRARLLRKAAAEKTPSVPAADALPTLDDCMINEFFNKLALNGESRQIVLHGARPRRKNGSPSISSSSTPPMTIPILSRGCAR